MNLYDILIFIGATVIFSYIFDIFSSKTNIPSVILLIGVGMGLRALVDTGLLGDKVSELVQFTRPTLPLLGTVGLILIVLDGALDLEINNEKRSLIINSFVVALVGLLICSLGMTTIFIYVFDQPFQAAFLNSIPISVISSAVAIPTVKSFSSRKKEFVVYESSFSDILGVILFNFAETNPVITFSSFLQLGWELILIGIFSLITIALISILFERIGQHKKFILLLCILLLVYGLARKFHLSALILIFSVGLFANNSEFLLRKLNLFNFDLKGLKNELHLFYSFVGEVTFTIRTFFFLFFGFSINVTNLINLNVFLYAAIAVGIIFFSRFLYFYFISKQKDMRILWTIAPRGLITILLLYSIPVSLRIPMMNEDVVLVIVFASLIILTLGAVLSGRKKPELQTDKEVTT